MELFLENGHLTDEALRAAVDGALDEMGRLEVAEHLSFCDACLVRYTDLLEDDVLLTPSQPLTESVMERVRRKVVRLLFNRYAAAAAAVVLAVTFWSTGLFKDISTIRVREPEPPTTQSERHTELPAATRINAFFRTASYQLNQSITSLFE